MDNNNISLLLFLYAAITYESTEYVERVSGKDDIVSGYHDKIYALEKYIDEIDDPNILRFYIVNYYNHINAISDKKQYCEKSFEIYNKFIDLVYNKKVFDKAMDESLRDLIHTTETTWLIIDDVIEDAPDNIKKVFYDVSLKYYTEQLEENDRDLTMVDSQVYISYLHSRAMFNDITYEEAINSFLEYYFEKRKAIILDENISDDDFYFLVNGPISLEKLLCHVDEKKSSFIMNILNIAVDGSWEKIINAKAETPFVNNILTVWCTTTLKYCTSLLEKERKIFNLIVKRQLTTYIHSYMVKTLALAIFDTVYKKDSSLFSSINMSYEELSQYVEKAALLHDIGKAKICDTITMVRRKLADYEFVGIKNHPMYGTQIIGDDKDLSIYTDVIKGHHKWYNSEGGYPFDFDNTKSNYRIIIDIITLADCLDAATDYLGRNYKNAKTVKDVLVEFVRDKGIKYNPVIVDIIVNDEKLVEELDRLTSTNRLDAMYTACENQILVNKKNL